MHVRPSAHEADELLLLHSAAPQAGFALELDVSPVRATVLAKRAAAKRSGPARPHVTQRPPRTASAAAFVKQVHAPRFSRYQPSVFWSPVLAWRIRAATGNRTRISSLASSRLTIGQWPHGWSPRPDLHRNRLFTKQLLAYSSCGDTWVRRATGARQHLLLQRKDSNLHLSQ